jgi:hypothetical protein
MILKPFQNTILCKKNFVKSWFYLNFLFIIFLFTSNGTASVIACLKNDSTVYLLADSRVAYDTLATIFADTACKIIHIKNVFFAISGTFLPSQFDEFRQMFNGINDSLSILMHSFIKRFESKFKNLIVDSIKKPMNFYIIFVSNFGEKIEIGEISMKYLTRDTKNIKKLIRWPSELKNEKYLFLTQTKIPAKIITKKEDFFLNPLSTINKFTDKVLEFDPIWKGYPIDLVKITPNSYEWIQKKENCNH